jgi:Zn-dependent M16 (insulinase) family peptidase
MSERQWALGDELSGFSVVEISPYPEYKGVGYLFRHIENNMEVFQVVMRTASSSSAMIQDAASNDCGIAHIPGALRACRL